MKNRMFYIKAIWDEGAKVYVSESDIIGLHIEAPTLEEFESVMNECATVLIIENHIKPKDLASKRIKDLIPSIIWRGVAQNGVAA